MNLLINCFSSKRGKEKRRPASQKLAFFDYLTPDAPMVGIGRGIRRGFL
jgi:hypothetical protein